MNAGDLIKRTELHDSSLIQAATEENRVSLLFEDVWADGNCYRVAITFDGVCSITRDGKIIAAFDMEGEFGDVLAFERRGHTATLVLEWFSSVPPKEETRAYTFEFATFDAKAEKQENPPG